MAELQTSGTASSWTLPVAMMTIRTLLQAVREGFPDDHRAVHSAVKPYFTIRDHL